MEESRRRARRRVEDAAARFRGGSEEQATTGIGVDLKPGDRVRLGDKGPKGTVVEVREGRGVVETSGARLQVPVEDLLYMGPPLREEPGTAQNSGPAASSWQGPEAEPETELDLRGLRVSEVGGLVDRALDQAILGGLGELRIIHGKGTGALRETVSELLSNDGRVSGFRLGGPGEGGAGVTIVSLR